MPQSSERVNSFLERARACRVAAEMASNAEARATYLDLADSWQTLAKQVGCLDASYEATREAAIAFAKSWRRESGRAKRKTPHGGHSHAGFLPKHPAPQESAGP